MEYPPSLEQNFAARRDEFRLNAHNLLEYLCAPVLDHQEAELHDDDRQALEDLSDLEVWETTLNEPLIAADSSYGLVERFEPAWRSFQAALPFTMEERTWFLDPEDTTAERADKENQEATIISAGVHKVISGRELVRRWLAWRRETDEFEGQGTLDIAREALRSLHEVVAPGELLPDSYIRLRAEPTA